ncbi:MAG: hypothetical protein P8Z31_07790 [Gammaproteobacteria bacterium]|jgi:hypothetical protein
MLPKAHIVHRIRGRLRIRIPEECLNSDYFASLQEQLESLPVVSEVEVSAVSGSVLLLHPLHAFEEVRSELERLGLFELTTEKPPAMTPMEAVTAKIARTDDAINEISSGGLDLRTLAFVAAILLALQQAIRGNFSGPAIPMILAALSLLPPGGGNAQSDE